MSLDKAKMFKLGIFTFLVSSLLLSINVQAMPQKEYPLAYWSDFHKWYNGQYMTIQTVTDVSPTAIIDTYQNKTIPGVMGPNALSTYQGHFDTQSAYRATNGIPAQGKTFTVGIDVKNNAANILVTGKPQWLRMTVACVFHVSTPFVDPIYGGTFTELFMEFDYYWGSTDTKPREQANFRFLKIAQITPNSGWAHLDLPLTEQFIQRYGQATYDSASLEYVSAGHVELGNSHAQLEFRNVNLLSTESSPNPTPTPTPTPTPNPTPSPNGTNSGSLQQWIDDAAAWIQGLNLSTADWLLIIVAVVVLLALVND